MTAAADAQARCRSCGSDDLHVFLSLGKLPLPDALLREDQLSGPEGRFPLDVAHCRACSLVQLLGHVPSELMFVDNYLYFSSFSDDLLEHARQHAEELITRRDLDAESLVVEVASNDGYLLRNFVTAGIPCLGVDPTPGPAAEAERIGVPTLREFFGRECARRIVAKQGNADVVIANNVMAHVDDLNDFVGGLALLVADDGVITVENPYVRDLIDHGEFDTIYHEHVCYYSCTSVDRLAARHGLFLNHVEYFPHLHGGTLRWHIGRREDRSDTLRSYLREEQERGITEARYYEGFGQRVEAIRSELRRMVTQLREQGHRVAAYGAAAKGTVMLNYVGLDHDLIDFVVDRNVHKQGLFMPGVHLPILAPEALLEEAPDYTILLAWNFTDEILRQQQDYLDAGGRFIRPVPWPEVLQ